MYDFPKTIGASDANATNLGVEYDTYTFDLLAERPGEAYPLFEPYIVPKNFMGESQLRMVAVQICHDLVEQSLVNPSSEMISFLQQNTQSSSRPILSIENDSINIAFPKKI